MAGGSSAAVGAADPWADGRAISRRGGSLGGRSCCFPARGVLGGGWRCYSSVADDAPPSRTALLLLRAKRRETGGRWCEGTGRRVVPAVRRSGVAARRSGGGTEQG